MNRFWRAVDLISFSCNARLRAEYHNQAKPQCGQWCKDGHDVTQRQYQSGGPSISEIPMKPIKERGKPSTPVCRSRPTVVRTEWISSRPKKKQGGQQALGYPKHRIHGLAPSGTSSYPQLTISPEHSRRMIIYFAPSEFRIAFVSAWNSCDSTILPSRIL